MVHVHSSDLRACWVQTEPESECWAQTEAESGCEVQLRADPEWRRQNQNAERRKKLSQDAKCSSVQIVDGEG